MARVALRVLSLQTTSASVERVFSVGRSLAADCRMAMKPEMISTRVMIQANLGVALVSLQRILALGRNGWKQLLEEREAAKRQEDDRWRSEVLEESASQPASQSW
jgi:hypothetical protein